MENQEPVHKNKEKENSKETLSNTCGKGFRIVTELDEKTGYLLYKKVPLVSIEDDEENKQIIHPCKKDENNRMKTMSNIKEQAMKEHEKVKIIDNMPTVCIDDSESENSNDLEKSNVDDALKKNFSEESTGSEKTEADQASEENLQGIKQIKKEKSESPMKTKGPVLRHHESVKMIDNILTICIDNSESENSNDFEQSYTNKALKKDFPKKSTGSNKTEQNIIVEKNLQDVKQKKQLGKNPMKTKVPVLKHHESVKMIDNPDDSESENSNDLVKTNTNNVSTEDFSKKLTESKKTGQDQWFSENSDEHPITQNKYLNELIQEIKQKKQEYKKKNLMKSKVTDLKKSKGAEIMDDKPTGDIQDSETEKSDDSEKTEDNIPLQVLKHKAKRGNTEFSDTVESVMPHTKESLFNKKLKLQSDKSKHMKLPDLNEPSTSFASGNSDKHEKNMQSSDKKKGKGSTKTSPGEAKEQKRSETSEAESSSGKKKDKRTRNSKSSGKGKRKNPWRESSSDTEENSNDTIDLTTSEGDATIMFPSGTVINRDEYPPNKCAVCKQNFSNNTEFREHLLTHRTGESGFQCMECGESYMSRGSFRIHTLAYHLIKDTDEYINKNNCRY